MAAAALLAVAGFPAGALGQTPTVDSRVVAASGLPDPDDPNNLGEPVWETWIAAGSSKVIAVHHQEVSAGGDVPQRIAYSIFDRQSQSWSESGIVPDDPNSGARGLGDPSIVWLDSGTDEFVACGLVSQPGPPGRAAVGIARYSSGGWSSWQPLTAFLNLLNVPYDKPWICAGDSYPTGRELYITFWRAADGGRHRYMRTMDGGDTWIAGDITDGLEGAYIGTTAGNYQPAVVGDGPLYIAYVPAANTREIRFLRGSDIDDPNDLHFGEVEFRRMRRLCPLEGMDGPMLPELVLTRNRTVAEIPSLLPGGGARVGIGVIPFLAADPTDSDRLYVAYHDTATDLPNDTDMNVYLQALTRSSNGWCAADRVEVNDAISEHKADQFMPQVAVDSDGGVHVIFYDDRQYVEQADDANTPEPQFDVYYAFSSDGGQTFVANIELAKDPNGADPNEACLDYELLDGFKLPNRPGDYNGICVYGDEVWTSFTGTWQDELDLDPDNNPTVIWSSLITLSP